MRIEGALSFGVFLRRPNRFLAICKVGGRELPCYLPNPGPMPDLLYPGLEVLVRHAPAHHRKTEYDLIGVRNRGVLLSLDSRVPNKLLAEAFSIQSVPPFAHYSDIKPEPSYLGSRLDFLLQNGTHNPCLIEAKSSTHAEHSIAYFPRAVTLRGQRHLQELMHAVDNGYRAAIIFIVQRSDAHSLRPHDLIDPDFGSILRKAVSHGVEAFAWSSHINESTFEITLGKPLPVD
ncbi:MAG: DNA/RNA nuclease SfsA, partial [Promethearchaeota archaeon]